MIEPDWDDAQDTDQTALQQWYDWYRRVTGVYHLYDPRRGESYGLHVCAPIHKQHSHTQDFESLDHFLFQAEIGWNGKILEEV